MVYILFFSIYTYNTCGYKFKLSCTHLHYFTYNQQPFLKPLLATKATRILVREILQNFYKKRH